MNPPGLPPVGAVTRRAHAPRVGHPARTPDRGVRQAFAQALLDPDAPVPPGLVAWNGSDVGARLAVHRNHVVASLVGVLADSFPVVRELVGTEFFAAIAASHLREQPPRSPVMADYGGGFADWLAAFEPAAGLPWLADVAQLEWARLRAQHAADADALPPPRLAAALASPEALTATRLRLHPTVQCLRLAHPAVSLWAAHQQPEAGRDAALAAIDLDAPESALVLRPQDEVLVLSLADADAALVQAWQCGQTLGAALAAHPLADLTTTLALLLRHGAVVGLDERPCNARPSR